MVGRFNGRVGAEVLGITIHSHAQLERLLRGFNAAYNARRQRVLGGKTPDQVVAERLKARRKLARAKPEGRAGPEDIAKARLIAEAAKEVSQPDTPTGAGRSRPGWASARYRAARRSAACLGFSRRRCCSGRRRPRPRAISRRVGPVRRTVRRSVRPVVR